MKLKPEQLESHLRQPLLPVYLLSGDEPLLIQEAADLIRAEARRQGFTEREVLHAEAGFQWEEVPERANSLSLFAERILLELHIPNGKPGQRGSETLTRYLEAPSPDTLLLIFTPRLDAGTQKQSWFKAVEKAGATLAFWPLEAAQLPGWIRQRLNRAGLRTSDEVCRLLAERTEGNLLAAVQEIERLRLSAENDSLDEELVLESVADNARFDVFALSDAALSGQPGRALRILDAVRNEGVEATLVVWSLARELRTLLELALECRGAPPSDALCRKHRLWGKRKTLVNRALPGLSPRKLEALLQQTAAADQAIKGMNPQLPWDLLSALVADLAQLCRNGRT